jgi:DNA-binding NarL/FixJ family response regulator
MLITKVLKVLIVEDHPLFSKGLASLITSRPVYQVVGEAVNSAAAITIIEREKPDLAIVDLNLGDETGLDLIPRMKALAPNLVILALSMYEEQYYSERVLRLGAKGYIMKDQAGSKVLDAIKTVMSGKVYLSESERDRLLEAMALNGESSKEGGDMSVSVRKLSNRQLEIFSLIGKGLGTIEIAAKLNLSPKTIDTHKEHIKLKLHCENSVVLRKLAIDWTIHPTGIPTNAIGGGGGGIGSPVQG